MSKATSSGCVFCRIVLGELPASIVYADQNVLAYMDLHPNPLEIEGPANDDRHSME